MGQRLLQRRLAQISARVRELSEELRIVEDQLSHLVDEADEKSLRALVAETPTAQFEYREVKRHTDVMQRRRDDLVVEISESSQRIDELLDRIKESQS